MTSVDRHLETWLKAGVIDEATAIRIRVAETAAHPDDDNHGDDRPGLLEALVYVGVALAAVGAAVLIGTRWGTFGDGVRVGLFAAAAIVAGALGWSLLRTNEPGLRRGGSAALVAMAGFAAATAGVWADAAGSTGEQSALAAFATGLATSAAAWASQPRALQAAATAAFCVPLAPVLAELLETQERRDGFVEFNPNFFAGGLVVLGLGLILGVVAERGLARPQQIARVGAGAVVAWGAFFAGLGGGLEETLALGAAAGLIAASIWRGTFLYVLSGVALLFIALVATVVRHVDNPTTTALALMAIGGALIATVILLARTKPWRRLQPRQHLA